MRSRLAPIRWHVAMLALLALCLPPAQAVNAQNTSGPTSHIVSVSGGRSPGAKVGGRGTSAQGVGDQAAALTGPYTENLAQGRSKAFSIAFENTGSTTWTTAGGYTMKNAASGLTGDLGPCDPVPPDQGDWCVWEVVLNATGVAPGTYTLNYQMFHGVTAFGPAITITVTVTSLPAVGGRGLNLTRGSTTSLVWTGGTQQTGYLVIRWTPTPTNTFAFLPSPTQFLGASATSYTDTSPLPEPTYCYIVFAFGGSPPSYADIRGASDLLCVFTAAAQGTAPTNFAVELEGSTTKLTWDAAGVTSYVLTTSTFDGLPPSDIVLNGPSDQYKHNTGNKTTCYQLRSIVGSATFGITNKLCVAPGSSFFTAGSGRLDPRAAMDRLNTTFGTAPR